ncbi:sensor histidine kinase [Aureimonas mangrovi]|uniref:sensor histidine kinase n=1 Tax=Aureimonas mangrovi TaxID=2758041 RepID=UPI00163D6BB4|nr:extracellular solute-binding protein [Aureimonas mangrovi]
MRPDGVSIRRRVLTLATALLLMAALVLVIFIRDYAERSSDRAFDRLLAASALTIAGAVQVQGGDVTVELPLASFDMFTGGDRIFYVVEAPDGGLVTGYDDLSGTLAPADDDDPVFADIDYRGEALRVATVGRLVAADEGAGWVTIRVAETQNERYALSAEIMENALVPVALLTVLSLVIVWFGVGRAFRPLNALERHLRAREPDNLAPVDIAVPIEVRQLVAALNGFMARLLSSRARLEALVAEAAHEVRTPLASLRAQAEVARGERDPDALRRQVERIHQGAVQASQLVSQLLMDATISHRLETRERAETRLGALMREVTGRLDPDFGDRVDTCITEEAAGLVLAGDRVGLREMLRNLVDNALLYSQGPVLIEVKKDGEGRVAIAVMDRGPGIADDEKPLVVQRFKRGASGAGKSGSGLGLSIVARVAEGQGGRLDLEDRPGGGLVARVVLPVGGAVKAPRPLIGLTLALLCLASLAFGMPAQAASTFYPARGGAESERLNIAGTTDTPLFTLLVEAFQESRPGLAVDYFEIETLPLYENFLAGTLPLMPDILMSSASDLQVKLANDGHAITHHPPEQEALPEWAQWRSEVFGFSFEPAVFVYNRDEISEDEVPRTHLAFAELLEANPARFIGRVATYDIETSGVGYLLAAQDQTISSSFWRLASAFGRARVRLSGSSPDILSRIESGNLILAYNVLGSYALARQAAGADIGIVVPDDYVLVLTRSMLIPKGAGRPDLAGAFLDFTVSPQGQAILAGQAALGAVVPGSVGTFTAEAITARGRGAVQPIALEPSLLVALDRLRRARFLDTWRGIVQPR